MNQPEQWHLDEPTQNQEVEQIRMNQFSGVRRVRKRVIVDHTLEYNALS